MSFNGVWITFNGEIYNYKEIRNELVKLGHSFIGNSDTEIILHAYVQWGVNCISKLIGMFAIVLYDEVKQLVYCVRDRAGIKPFFIIGKMVYFLFASELKHFHEHPNFEKRLNLDSVASFLQFGNVPTPHCIFEDCYKLSPGHYIEFNVLHSKLDIHKYWDVYDSYNKPKLEIDFEEAKRKRRHY
ncbi:MAG: asparagine synthetase B, partial [Bacteroidetes bacterium]|nr:asparagine synthetase B [Bacteroidota bacterium]